MPPPPELHPIACENLLYELSSLEAPTYTNIFTCVLDPLNSSRAHLRAADATARSLLPSILELLRQGDYG